jgi:hypothetical protein
VPELYAGALFFPVERASDVMHAWHEFVEAGIPEELGTVGRIVNVPPLEHIPEAIRGRSFAIVQAVYLGNERDGAALLRPLAELGPAMNTFATVEPGALGFLGMDPDAPVPAVGSSRMLSDLGSAGIDALLGAAGPGSGSTLASVELRALGGALARRTPGHGALAKLEGDYLLFAVGGVFAPQLYGEVRGRAAAVSNALGPWDSGTRNGNFEADDVDARLFYDEDTWRLLRALRTHWDPTGIFLANHEIKDS